MTQNDKKFCLTSYLSNCTSYECDFWYTCVKWWYLQQFVSFCQNSDFSGFSKFINKCQKEILRFASPQHVCDFLFICHKCKCVECYFPCHTCFASVICITVLANVSISFMQKTLMTKNYHYQIFSVV